jgi:hypothetical protein
MLTGFSMVFMSVDEKFGGYMKLKHLLNSFQAIAPLTAHEKGVIFLGGISPSKIDPKKFY